MTSNTSEAWSPTYGTATFTSLSPTQTPMSPSRLSSDLSESHRQSSEGDEDDSAHRMRRITVSPTQNSNTNSDTDSLSYADDNSISDAAEVEAALNSLDEELDNTQDALTQWSRSSTSDLPSTYGSDTGTSPSYVTRPLADPRIRLSTITERTENSRPTSQAFSTTVHTRPANPTPDALRRSAFLSGTSSPSSHSRSSTDPGDRGLPPPGRATELIAVFEVKSPSGHSRTASAPGGPRTPSPYMTASQSTPNLPSSSVGYGYGSTTGYGYGSTGYGYGSRSSSPTKSKSSSSTSSGTGPVTMSSFLSPPPRASTSLSTESRLRPSSPGTGTYLSPSTYTNTFTTTGTTATNTNTFTATTPTASSLRRPQTSPRSPLTSVRNIVAAWKERTPLGARTTGKSSAPESASSVSPPTEGDSLFGMRRRAQRAGTRLKDTGRDLPPLPQEAPANSPTTPRRSGSIRSIGLPPGFDAGELSAYTQSNEAPLHIGLLWYLNVHAPPPYRWQRCQALLYPHLLLLSWLAPGGGRGIVALDLLNCTNVQSAPSPTHPSARDDVGTVAARLQSSERDGQPLMDMLVPFHMLYADGVERLAAESLLERQKWVNRLWEAVHPSPTALPESSTRSRSPTGSVGSIRTILSTSSHMSNSSSGSRSTIFLPPLSEIPDMSDVLSSNNESPKSHVFRRTSLVSSHHTGTVDDTVISNQQYLYPGDPRVITPSRRNSLRRTSSMTDLDEEFASAVNRARGARPGLGFARSVVLGVGSPVTVSSGPSLGADVFVTPPPSSVGRGSDRSRTPRGSASTSSISDEAFFSAGSGSGTSSTNLSSFYSQTSFTRDRTTTGLITDETVGFASGGSSTQIVPSTLSIRRAESASFLGDSHDSGSGSGSYTPSSTSPSRTTLSRTGGVRRRMGRASSRSLSSSYQYGSGTDESSDKENSGSYTHSSDDFTPSGTRSSDETGYDVCHSSDLSDFTPYTYTTTTRSSSNTPVPPSSSSSSGRSSSDEAFVTASQGSSDYVTAKTPSTSYESLPTIPSDSEYSTAEEAPSTEYVTASEPPTDSEYITAELCPTEPSTEYETAEPKDIPSIPTTPRISEPEIEIEQDLEEEEREEDEETKSIGRVPSIIGSIPSALSELDLFGPVSDRYVSPQNIPLPLSETSSYYESESGSIISSSPTPSSDEISDVPTPTSILTPSVEESPDESVTRTEAASTEPHLPTSLSTPTESSLTSTTVSDLSPSSTYPPSPPRPLPTWGQESNLSYESSQLGPSPSVRSLALQEGLETSFDTSLLRPSGSSLLSSLDRLTPISDTPTPLTSISPVSITPSSLTSSISSPGVPTPSSISSSTVFSTSSSSLERTPSIVSQASISSDIFDSRSLIEEPFLGEEPSTEPSLLTTHRPESSQRLLSPAPASSRSLWTPEGTISVSISTPSGQTPSVHSDLRTATSSEASQPVQPARGILHDDINQLLQYLYGIDQVRGQENRDLAANVQRVRQELEDLADFLRREPSPTPVVAPSAPPAPIPLVDRQVETSAVVSPEQRIRELTPVPSLRLSRFPSTRSSSSVGSFLSSHHSDDFSLLESYPAGRPDSPRPWSEPSEPSDSSSSSSSPEPTELSASSSPSSISYPGSSRSSSSPPLPPSSPSISSGGSTSTVRPPRPPPDILSALNPLRDQLNALWQGQVSTNHMLDELRGRRPVSSDSTELTERLQRIEDLMRVLLEQPRGVPVTMPIPEPVHAPPPVPVTQPEEQSPSDLESSVEGGELEGLYEGVSGAPAPQPPAIPIRTPVPTPAGPSFVQQLEDLIAAGSVPPPASDVPPPLIPFSWQPSDRARPAISPTLSGYAAIPLRPATEPRYFPREPPRQQRAPPREPQWDRRTQQEDAAPSQAHRAEPPVIPTPPGRRTIPERQPRPGPRPEPVLPPLHGVERAPSAPSDLAQDRRSPSQTWYRPPAQNIPGIPPSGQRPQPSYFPMPAGPTVVQMPPIFDTLMEILRENRLAQMATVDQQRELMRYMRGLNGWLERDVHDRQAELLGVSARLDQLRADLNQLGAGRLGVGVRPAGPPGGDDSSSSSDDEQGRLQGGPPMPRPQPTGFMPQPPVFGPQPPFPPGFVPHGFVPDGPVIPSVVPGFEPRTPTPAFQPVIPPPPIIVNQPGRVVIPDFPGQYGPLGPRYPEPDVYRPPESTDQNVPFVPPRYPRSEGSRSSSSSERRPMVVPPPGTYPIDPTVINVAATSPSSSSSGTDSPSHRPYHPHRERSRSRSRSRSQSTPPSRRSSRRRPSGAGVPDVTQDDAGHPPISRVPSHPQIIPIVSSEPRAGSHRHPDAPQPQQPTIVINQPPQPMPQPMPPGMPGPIPYYPSQGQTIVSGRSRSSSQSSVSQRPIIIDRPRSHSRSRSHSYTPPSQLPATIIVPPSGPPIDTSRSRRSHSSRSGSRSPRTIVVSQPTAQPGLPIVPVIDPRLPLPSGGRRTPEVVVQRSSSHSRPGSPIIVSSTPRRSHSGRSQPLVVIPGGDGSSHRSRRQRSPHGSYYSEADDARPSHHRGRPSSRPPRSRGSQSPEEEQGSRRPSRQRTHHSSRSPEDDRGSHHPSVRSGHRRSLSPERDQGSRHPSVRPSTRRPLSPERDRGSHHPSRHPSVRSTHRSQSPESPSQGPSIPYSRSVADPGERHPLPGHMSPPTREDDGEIPRPVIVTIPSQRAISPHPTLVRVPGPEHIAPQHPEGDMGLQHPLRTSPGYEPSPSVYIPEEQHGPSRPRTPRSLRSQILETDAPVIPVVQRDTGGAKPTAHRPEGPSDYEPIHPPEGLFEPQHPAVVAQPGSPTTSVVPIPAGTPIPGGLAYDDAERERQERFGEVERQLLDAARTAAEAEDHREMEFRRNEEDRRRIFLESEERRDEEARERRDQVWQDLEARLAGPPPQVQPTEPEHPGGGDSESIIESIRTATQEAASRHASDILETIKLEREEFAREREAAAAERERLVAEAEAERVRLNEERESRIKSLEEELANVRAELENEKQQRITEEAATREREGQESQERDEAVRGQLGDITNLVQEQRDMCAAKKELMDQRWEEKQGRREAKDASMNELRNMVQKLHEDLEADRVRAAEARQEAEGKPGIEKVIEELQRQNAEQRELLNALSDSWRADCTRQHGETLEAVRATAREQIPFNVQGYLDEFSKALASEVRMLLGEVGKLREERRALQHELGYLLCMKSKYGPGGEFEPDWKPPPGAPGGPPLDQPPPDAPPPPPELPQPAKPGWRTVTPRRTKKKKEAAPPPPAASVPDPRQQTQSWATWQPEPRLAPTPPSIEPTLLVPSVGSPGLFGPRSPHSSQYRG